MEWKIVFARESLSDLREAKAWYNRQQSGLGKRLADDVKSTLLTIKSNPYHASIKFANIRTTACSVFPYAIHYEIDEQQSLIRVVSIFHFSRRPYWT